MLEVSFQTKFFGHLIFLYEFINYICKAYWEAEKDAVQKEETKRKERVIKRWVKLIHGLRIRQRLRAQYTSGGVDELLTQPEMSLKDTVCLIIIAYFVSCLIYCFPL